MLGEELKDPYGIEHGGDIEGIGLLPMVTVFEEEKTRTRVSGVFRQVEGIFSKLAGVSFEGYEIHMGASTLREGAGIAALAELQEDGKSPKQDGLNCGNVYGSYVHGIFDQEEVAKTLISALLREKGLADEHVAAVDMKAYKERQYDLLAEGIRKNIDMDLVYRIVETGI